MLSVGTPQIWAGPGAEVGLIALRLMDPPPAKVLPKIYVEGP